MKKLLERVDISDIVSRHISSLSSASSGKRETGDYLLFLALPIGVTVFFVYYRLFLNKDLVDILCTSLSIFVGLFFNVIVLIFDLTSKTEKGSLKNKFLRELLANISFEIFISVFCILFAVCSLSENIYVKYVANIFTFFLTSLFFVTLLMILKRTFDLFIKEIENPDGVSSKY